MASRIAGTFAATVVTVAAVASLTACSSGGSHPSAHVTGTAAPGAAARWWQDSNASVGSAINLADPTAAARGLVPDRASYCTILRQTVAAGHGVLATAKPGDRNAIATVRAWLAELEAVAPPAVLPAWQVTGSSVTTLLANNGKVGASTLPPGVTAAQLASAGQTIASDAKSACNLTLSAS